MKNLTKHGDKFLWIYINDYRSGLISEREVRAYLGVCFMIRIE